MNTLLSSIILGYNVTTVKRSMSTDTEETESATASFNISDFALNLYNYEMILRRYASRYSL